MHSLEISSDVTNLVAYLLCSGLIRWVRSWGSDKLRLGQVSWRIPSNHPTFSDAHPVKKKKILWNQIKQSKIGFSLKKKIYIRSNWYSLILVQEKLTSPPREIFPPKSSSTESDIAVESRRNTEFTFTFSLNTNHGYGILASLPLTEFWYKEKRRHKIIINNQLQ